MRRILKRLSNAVNTARPRGPNGDRGGSYVMICALPVRHTTMSTTVQPRTLGTPLSPAAVRVLLLGAGELGKEVILALQRLGVEVIAADRYPNAPGHQVAHRAHVLNMADPGALRALIEQERPHIVVPEIEAIATGALVEIEREGLAQVIPTARAAQLTMNREGIRRLAAEDLGLPTSPYRFADSLAELTAAVRDVIGLPCIIKPVMSSSGKGQSKVDRLEDLPAAWDYAQSGARVGLGRVIVEGFVRFDYEITQLTVRHRLPDGTIGTAFCEPIGHIQVHGDYVESWQPQPMSPLALERSREIARKVTANLGGLGIFGVELFIRADEVWFSEVSPRPHDTGLVTLATQHQSEFELHARALLGLPVDTSLRSPGASSVIYGGVDAKAMVFDGVADALAIPGTDLRLFGKPESFTKRRMGVAVAHAPTVEEARTRAKAASACVRPRAA
jgi:phosphoribosylglycinamide formyltransferase 2